MQRPLDFIATTALALGTLAATSSAQSQTLINQEKVMAGTDYGYFQDAPGFPLSILAPGHYKLTGNLTVPAGKSGIDIYAAGVTLDLNGFEITTNAICTRTEASASVTCNSAALGDNGVEFKVGGSVLRNGRINGFTHGVQFKGGDLLENLIVENNVRGIYSAAHWGARTLINSVRAQKNRESGFYVFSALIRGSTSSGNGYDGFSAHASMILDSVATNNAGVGFRGGSGTAAIGRSLGTGNRGGDFSGVSTLGQNINSAEQVF